MRRDLGRGSGEFWRDSGKSPIVIASRGPLLTWGITPEIGADPAANNAAWATWLLERAAAR